MLLLSSLNLQIHDRWLNSWTESLEDFVREMSNFWVLTKLMIRLLSKKDHIFQTIQEKILGTENDPVHSQNFHV